MSQAPPRHMAYSTAATTHYRSAPLDTREAAQSQECDGAFIYAPSTNVLEEAKTMIAPGRCKLGWTVCNVLKHLEA